MTTTRLYNSWLSKYYGTTAPNVSCYTAGRVYTSGGSFAAWGMNCHTTPGQYPANLNCYPWAALSPSAWELGFYSPATRCPTGWTAIHTSMGGNDFLPGESEIECCPYDYGRVNTSYTMCYQTYTDPADRTLTTCEAGASATTETITWTSVLPNVYGRTEIFAVPLQIRFRAADLTPATSTATARTTQAAGSGSRGGGLSPGAKIGIGVGVPLMVLFAAVVMFLFCFRKRPKQPKAKARQQEDLRSGEKETVVSARRATKRYSAGAGGTDLRPVEGEDSEAAYTMTRPYSTKYTSAPTVSEHRTYPDMDASAFSRR